MSSCSNCGGYVGNAFTRLCINCRRVQYAREFERRVQALVVVVAAYQSKEQRPPTIREIAQLMGVKSTATPMPWIDEAVRRGLLLRDPHCARSLRVKETMDRFFALIDGYVIGVVYARTEVTARRKLARIMKIGTRGLEIVEWAGA